MILALDSSTAELSLAILKPDADRLVLVGEKAVSDGGKHGTQLPQVIDTLMGETGVAISDLTACVGGLGPGSFTGLRVGLATLKGLCYARHIPFVGASSLRALAREAAEDGVGGERFCTLLDARHGHLYAAVYAGPSAELHAPEVSLRPAGLVDWLASHGAADARLIGEGVAAHREALSGAFPAHRLGGAPLHPRATILARECPLPLPAYDQRRLFAFEPHYVRASEAEEKFPQGTFVPRPI